MTVRTHHILGAGLAAALPVGVFMTKALAPLFVLIVVAVIVADRSVVRGIARLPRPLLVAAGLVAVFAAASAAWSITPLVSAEKAARFLGVLFGTAVLVVAARGLAEAERRFVLKSMFFGGGAAVALLLIEELSDSAILRAYDVIASGDAAAWSGVGRGGHGTIAALMVIDIWLWIAVAWKLGHRLAMVAGIAAFAVAIALESVDSPQFALLLGAAAAVAGFAARRLAPVAAAIVIVAGTLGAPAITGHLPDPRLTMEHLERLPMSALHRLVIWQNTLVLIRDHRVAGIGFDATRALFGPETRVHIQLADAGDGIARSNLFEPIPLHPHNGFLQIWLELGGIGAALFAGLFGLLALGLRRMADRRDVAVGLAMLTSAVFIFAISFGAWQAWWNCGLALALTGFSVASRPRAAG